MNPQVSYLLNQAIEAIQDKHLEDAERLLDRALGVVPHHPDALRLMGVALALGKKWQRALEFIELASALAPKNGIIHSNKGNILKELGRTQEAIASYDKAIALAPNYAEAYNNKGNALQDVSSFEESLVWYDKAIALAPDYAEAYNNKGNALTAQKKAQEALSWYDKAIHLSPDYGDAFWHKSMAQLALGNFSEGLLNYEARWVRTNAASYLFPEILPLADIKNLKNKKILVWCEQGLGDSLQFCRYVPLLANFGAKVTLYCPKALMKLFETLDGVEHLVSFDEGLEDHFDYQIPLMSLPLVFKTDLRGIPDMTPYLHASPQKIEAWRKKLDTHKGYRVGLVWSGGFRLNQPELWAINMRRNISLIEIARMQDVKNIIFYSLQKGDPAEAELKNQKDEIWPSNNLLNIADELEDFSDTAALIANLDLVISVDTSTAHLAGAMGKSVWLLNRHDSCWRWLLDVDFSPWYPSLKLYNQLSPGGWSEVISRVKKDLQNLAAQNKAN